jgi:hypothetical protein
VKVVEDVEKKLQAGHEATAATEQEMEELAQDLLQRAARLDLVQHDKPTSKALAALLRAADVHVAVSWRKRKLLTSVHSSRDAILALVRRKELQGLAQQS